MAQYRKDTKACYSLSFSLPLLSFVCWICVRLSLFIAEKEGACSKPHFDTCIAQSKRRHCCLTFQEKVPTAPLNGHIAHAGGGENVSCTDWLCLEQVCSI